MSIHPQDARCWVVRDGGGRAHNEDFDEHHDTEVSATTEITRIRDDYTPDPDYTPRSDAERQHAAREAVHLASLRPVQLPHRCFTVECAGCGETLENDAGIVHFADGEWQARDWDWATVDGLDYCENCRHEAAEATA